MACAVERVNLNMLEAQEVPVEKGWWWWGGHRGGALGEAGRHGRGMMDGSHASHCERIIARCRQLRQCGGQPKPWENKGPGSLCVSECRPARGAPNLHIYMRRWRVNCSEFLRWVQSGGCCCFILHNKQHCFFSFPSISKEDQKKDIKKKGLRSRK